MSACLCAICIPSFTHLCLSVLYASLASHSSACLYAVYTSIYNQPVGIPRERCWCNCSGVCHAAIFTCLHIHAHTCVNVSVGVAVLIWIMLWSAISVELVYLQALPPPPSMSTGVPIVAEVSKLLHIYFTILLSCKPCGCHCPQHLDKVIVVLLHVLHSTIGIVSHLTCEWLLLMF